MRVQTTALLAVVCLSAYVTAVSSPASFAPHKNIMTFHHEPHYMSMKASGRMKRNTNGREKKLDIDEMMLALVMLPFTLSEDNSNGNCALCTNNCPMDMEYNKWTQQCEPKEED